MTLLDPDAGEILDRLSILARKRLEKPDRAHFEAEELALLKHWEGNLKVTFYAEFLRQLLRLAAVNGALWQEEDRVRWLRGHREGADYELSTTLLGIAAVRLQALNEERSRLIQFFNAELGRGAVEEKDFKL